MSMAPVCQKFGGECLYCLKQRHAAMRDRYRREKAVRAANKAKVMNKFYLGKLAERNGEYEYIHNVPFETDGTINPEAWMDNYASEFYSGEAEPGDDGYYFHGGGIHISVDEVREITRAEHIILKQLGV